MVERGGLENRCTGNSTEGSNPSPSATQSVSIRRVCGVLEERFVSKGWQDIGARKGTGLACFRPNSPLLAQFSLLAISSVLF